MRGSEQGEKKKQKEKAMQETIQSFMDYLQTEKKASKNTELSYQRDLRKLVFFLKEHGIEKPEQVNATVLNSYLLYLEREQFSPATISRSIAAIHMFCQYACREGKMTSDPSKTLQPPKVERKMPEILSIAEVDLLLRQPKTDTPKGIRDKAMLEMLYATGIRVSELIHLQVSDLNFQFGYVICHDTEKERIIPIGNVSRSALVRYMDHGRAFFVKNRSEKALFTNCSGRSMSRQGFWKVLKGYVYDAGIQKDITPHTLRHSFAVHMLQNGADIKSGQEMLGHSDISSTQIYLGQNMAKMRDVYMKAHPRH